MRRDIRITRKLRKEGYSVLRFGSMMLKKDQRSVKIESFGF